MNKAKLEEAINIIFTEAKSLLDRENPTVKEIECSLYLLQQVKELKKCVKHMDFQKKYPIDI